MTDEIGVTFLGPRNQTGFRSRSRGKQSVAGIAIAGALALAITTYASVPFAADDIQQIKVGAEILYLPKAWIGFDSVFGAGTGGGSAIELPQPGIVEVAQFAMRPNAQWQSYEPWRALNLGLLPTFIGIGYGVTLPTLVGKEPRKVPLTNTKSCSRRRRLCGNARPYC